MSDAIESRSANSLELGSQDVIAKFFVASAESTCPFRIVLTITFAGGRVVAQRSSFPWRLKARSIDLL